MTNSIKNQHPDNYFSLLGLPVSFVVEKNTLINNYHDIQKAIHPDNFANAGERERRLSVQKAAQINDALETLKNPLKRSIYLLSLFDIELDDNSRVDPAFLMEQIELRENLSEVNDKMDPITELDSIIDDVKSRIIDISDSLQHLFQRLLANDEQGDAELLKQATAQVLKMQFLNRLQEECLSKEEDLANQL